MNASEKRYFCERLKSIRWEKEGQNRKKRDAAFKCLSLEQAQLISEGKVPFVKPLNGIGWGTALFDCYDFSGAVSSDYNSIEAEYNACEAAIKAAAQEIQDRCMLGDSEGAIEALKAFAEKEF